MVLFVTSADRPFTESERGFLQGIRDWGKKIVHRGQQDRHRGDPRGRRPHRWPSSPRTPSTLLGFAPEIFPVAARLALRAKTAGDAALLAQSRFEALERYIVDTLDEKERVRLKLMNPLGVAEHLSEALPGDHRRPARPAPGGLRGDRGHRAPDGPVQGGHAARVPLPPRRRRQRPPRVREPRDELLRRHHAPRPRRRPAEQVEDEGRLRAHRGRPTCRRGSRSGSPRSSTGWSAPSCGSGRR